MIEYTNTHTPKDIDSLGVSVTVSAIALHYRSAQSNLNSSQRGVPFSADHRAAAVDDEVEVEVEEVALLRQP